MLYYYVTHNVTTSHSVKVENTTNLSITLNETKPGQSYMVAVNAVNIVGVGAIATATCTLNKGLNAKLIIIKDKQE